MPDPHKDLAEIIAPAAPPPAAAPADFALPLALAGAAVLLALILWWLWRRRAPLRALRRLARSSAHLSDIPAAAAELARLTASRAAPAAWRRDLEQLRFARPAPDAAATLARLCREAEAFVRARGGNK
jgi:hypothetical protein